MTTHELRTYTPTPLTLSSEDARYLAQLFTDARIEDIRLTRPLEEAGVLLDMQSYVGVVPLPSGDTISCTARFPVENFPRMLRYAYDLESRMEARVLSLQTFPDFIELMLRWFCEWAEKQVSAGLARKYLEEEANLAFVRGTIAFAEDTRRNSVARQRTYCRFTELSWDIPENQIIRYVARRAQALAISDDLRWLLRSVEHELMSDVSLVPFTGTDISQITYNRLTESYRPLHNLCRLILDGMSFSDRAGKHLAASFLLDMNDVFERFVARALMSRLDDSALHVTQYGNGLHLGERLIGATVKPVLPLNPDLIFEREDVPLAVGDCKFKKAPGSGDFRQIFAYCLVTATERGLLILPRTEDERPDDGVDTRLVAELASSDILVRELEVDLTVPDVHLEDSIDHLAARVLEWIDAKRSASAASVA